jgi:putative spermidine/putrescine transport system permease protein
MKHKIGKYSAISVTIFISLMLFVVPLFSAAEYSFRGSYGKGHDFTNYLWIIQQDGFLAHLMLSVELGALAGALNLVLMVPTITMLHLTHQRFRPIVDLICILPLMIPVVSLAIGAEVSMPSFLQNSQYELVFFFVILALPFTYRVLDTSFGSIPLKTLVEASRSLGASWLSTIIRIILPGAKGGITAALFLSFALAIGEFTITQLLHWDTFPVWTVNASQQNILGAIALSVFSFTFAVVLLGVIAFTSSSRSKREIVVEEGV